MPRGVYSFALHLRPQKSHKSTIGSARQNAQSSKHEAHALLSEKNERYDPIDCRRQPASDRTAEPSHEGSATWSLGGLGAQEERMLLNSPSRARLFAVRVRQPLGDQRRMKLAVFVEGALANNVVSVFHLADVDVVDLLVAVILTHPFR